MNGYFEEINGNKYLTLVPTNESKEKIKKYGELWSKIRDLIKSMTKNSDDYDEKYMKIKFNSDDELPLNKTIDVPIITIFAGAIFLENNKFYPQFKKTKVYARFKDNICTVDLAEMESLSSKKTC